MTTVKRSVLALLLLLMISMPLTLFLCRKVQQTAVRHEMKEKLEYALLQTIRLPAADVHWYKEDKEIILKGNLFDVKSHHPVPGTDSVEFAGLFDFEETDIMLEITRMVQQNKENDPLDRLIVQAMCLLLIPLHNEYGLSSTCFYADRHFAPYLLAGLPSADLSVPAPPPKTGVL